MTTTTHEAGAPFAGSHGDASRSLTRYIVNFAAYTGRLDIPGEVMHAVKKSIMDVLRWATSASTSPTVAILQDFHWSLIPTAINGTAMPVDDYDDAQQTATGRFQDIHPSAPVPAALLAKSEAEGEHGRDLLVAYHVGVDVACELFDATASAPSSSCGITNVRRQRNSCSA